MGSVKMVAGRPSAGSTRPEAVGSSGDGAALRSTDNLAIVRGRVARPPVVREGAVGDVLVAWDLAVAGVDGGARSETVPVVWAVSASRSDAVGEGDELLVVGRVRRRFFRSGGVIQSRTEVVADQVIPARQRAKVSRAIGEAVARLAGG
jgi:single-strand DNA-binding protein